MAVASLYVKNLPPLADKLFLYEKFAPFGAILSVKVSALYACRMHRALGSSCGVHALQLVMLAALPLCFCLEHVFR